MDLPESVTVVFGNPRKPYSSSSVHTSLYAADDQSCRNGNAKANPQVGRTQSSDRLWADKRRFEQNLNSFVWDAARYSISIIFSTIVCMKCQYIASWSGPQVEHA